MDELNKELIVKLNLADAQIERLKAEKEVTERNLRDCRNELCLRCGSYRQSHLGACDGCRWRVDNG